MNEISIPLTKGKFALVDPSMSHLKDWKWCISSYGYAVRNESIGNGRSKTIYLQHCVIGKPLDNSLDVDHIDNNRLNNTIDNLRIVTHRQNLCNIKKKNDGKTSSKYPGVYFHKSEKCWIARIQINGMRKHLGCFKNEEDASKRYQEEMGRFI